MSCVKKQILIGGKEKEDRYACLEGKKENKKASYMLKPSWSQCCVLDSRSNYY